MKKTLAILLSILLLAACVPLGAISVSATTYGDANGDGKVNNQDLGLLQQYLNDWDVAISLVAADVDCNGRVNNKDLGLLQRYLNVWDVTLGPDEPDVPDEPSVVLPEVGYDLDGRGRIFVKEISAQDNVVTVTLENISSKWMTEETSYVEYTCTDAEGNVLNVAGKKYGTLYFGMLEAKEVDTYTFTIPTGTAKVAFGTCRTTYWTQWS